MATEILQDCRVNGYYHQMVAYSNPISYDQLYFMVRYYLQILND